MQRRDKVAARSGIPQHCPIWELGHDRPFRKFDRFHHLPHETIRENDDRISITVRQVKCPCRQINHFLRGIGRHDKGAIVAVAAALYHLVIVALLGGDVAKTGSPARDVRYDAWKLRPGHIADAFLHQADSRAA